MKRLLFCIVSIPIIVGLCLLFHAYLLLWKALIKYEYRFEDCLGFGALHLIIGAFIFVITAECIRMKYFTFLRSKKDITHK